MIERHLMPELRESLRDTPVTMLIGPRQSGKSTLAQALVAQLDGARYLSLDRGLTLAAAREDPAGFVAEAARTLVIDEVQRAPDLLREIKASVDRDRRPGRFVLTGSADVLTLPRVAETLAGRMEVLRLWPLSQGEIEGHREPFLDALLAGEPAALAASGDPPRKEDLLARIGAGGFPEAVARAGARRQRWFDSYLDTMLQREVRDLANLAGLADLPRLMLVLAARATGLLNYAGVSRDLGMPQTTLKRYVALLETAFLVLTVPAWFRNVGKRLIKSPKLILSDAGLLAHLLGGGEGVDRSFGAVLENFVMMEIVKQASVSDARPAIFHYRTAEGLEVDAVIERRGGPVCAVEVKAAATLTPRDSRGMRSLATALGDEFGTGVILHTGGEAVRLAPKIWALPLPVLWAVAA
ncbi:MAG: ATP-binding protein [Solirubrobacterales bacterium]|nr:ATP-binding protein [Solirubrobacterales bacterium]